MGLPGALLGRLLHRLKLLLPALTSQPISGLFSVCLRVHAGRTRDRLGRKRATEIAITVPPILFGAGSYKKYTPIAR